MSSQDISQIAVIQEVRNQKWISLVTIVINNEYNLVTKALIDTGADYNCIRHGIIPSKYYVKTHQHISNASGKRMDLNFKVQNAHICNSTYCFPASFMVVNDLDTGVILGTPFIVQLYPFTVDSQGIVAKPFDKDVIFPFIFPETKKSLNCILEEKILEKRNYVSSLKENIKQVIEKIKVFVESSNLTCLDVPASSGSVLTLVTVKIKLRSTGVK